MLLNGRRMEHPQASRRMTMCSRSAAVLMAAALALPSPAAQAQPAPARRMAAPPATAQAPLAAPAPASRTGGPGPACNDVREDPQPYALAVGKTTRYRPASAVVRMVLDDQTSESGVPGALSPAAPAGGTAAPGGGSSTVVGLTARAPTNSQSVGARPGVGEIAVRLLSPTDIYLTGKRIGAANVVMVHAGGSCTLLNVVVGMDPSGLQAAIDQLLPEERERVPEAERVKVSAAFDSLVLKGTVSDSEALVRVTDLANAYLRGGETNGNSGAAAANPRIVNMLTVGAPQQVMLEVKVAEVSKNLLDQFGIDFSRAYVPGDGSMVRFLSGILGGGPGILGQISRTGPNGVPFSSVDAVVGGQVAGIGGAVGGNVILTPQGYVTQYGTVPGRGVTNGVLNMQKNDGLVKVLAEPSVMAISGQTGSFLAGGKIFIPVAQSNDLGGRTVTLEEKEFGVSVKFTPTVLGNGRIHLKVRPEVSELNAGGVTITGVGGSAVLPSFTSRKAETTVQLMDGQSFVIGGLVKNNTTTNIKAFPFLGELPVIGLLFRSTEFQTDRSELVFVITPRLVKPLPADYRLPTDNYVPPTRRELIFEGKAEGQRPAEPAPTAAPVAVPPPPAGGGFDTRGQEKK
jgi:pilus assembly protein CpaC